MTSILRSGLGLLAAALAGLTHAALEAADTNSWTLTSPDGRSMIAVSLDAEGRPTYAVSHQGRLVIQPSPLGIVRDDESFERGLRVSQTGPTERRREQYELFAGIAPRVDRPLNVRSLEFLNPNSAPLTIDLAASDEGVALRYRFTGSASQLRVVQSELTGFHVPPGTRGWLQPYHAAGPYTPAYEDFYFQVAPGELPPRSRDNPRGWCFPALFQVPAGNTWVLVTESATDGSYPGCHLAPDSANGIYRIAFPLPDEHTKGQATNQPPNPRWQLPWTMPWRVLVLATNAATIATSTLVTDLAPASRLADTSWIKPGRASWAWWSHPDGPFTAEIFNEFTDFAATMGWEYTLFDACWWTPGLPVLVQHANEKSILPLAWLHASDFYEASQRARKLDEMAAAGVRGVKVDFWCSDRQETIAAMQALFEDAAKRKLLVTLHGCTLPRGWQRTWPNFVTAEAVLGNESYFYESRYTEKAPELNAVLPFTRNVAGPMDSTPVAASPKKYARRTTAAHELATAIIFTSGIIHYADRPAFFQSLPPEVLRVFRDAPARWDETRCLVGEPGKIVVFARRAGASWFIAGINGSDAPQAVALDLAPFKEFRRRHLVTEARESQMEVRSTSVETTNLLQHTMPARGGFILRLDQ